MFYGSVRIEEYDRFFNMNKKLKSVFVVLSFLISALALNADFEESRKEYQTKWIGHRGSRGPFVQNTIPAFKEGVKRGYFALEMDLRVSSDGVFYVCHDDVFLPYLFVDEELHQKPMGNYTWDELKDLEIKNRRNNPTHFDTLDLFEDYLKIVRDNDVHAIIELKWTNGINNNDTGNVEELIQKVKSYEIYERATFFTSMKGVLDHIRKNYPDANLMLLTGSQTTNQENVDWAIERKISMGIIHPMVTEEIVSKLHEAGLKVNAWTVNSEKDAERLRSLKVDFITTDDLGTDGKVHPNSRVD